MKLYNELTDLKCLMVNPNCYSLSLSDPRIPIFKLHAHNFDLHSKQTLYRISKTICKPEIKKLIVV